MLLLSVTLCLDALVPGATAQDFTVPSTWRVEFTFNHYLMRWLSRHVQRPSTSLSVSDREGIANSAGDILVSRINFSKGTVDGTFCYCTISAQ